MKGTRWENRRRQGRAEKEGLGVFQTLHLLLQARIIYYSQEKYFHHVQQAAAVGLETFSNDPVLQFFKAFAVLKKGQDSSRLASRNRL